MNAAPASIPSLLVATESAPGSRPGTLGALIASSTTQIIQALHSPEHTVYATDLSLS